MSLVSFTEFLNEVHNTVYFTFGRMNPPTRGHEKLLESLARRAGKNPYRVYLSHSCDNKKNPMMYEEKIKTCRKFFPRHARHIHESDQVKNPLDAAKSLYEEGFKNIVMVVGSDRVQEFQERLERYNQDLYEFESIRVLSAGERDPDSEGVDGISSSALRESVQQNDFVSFSQGLPKHVTNSHAKQVFNSVRKGLGHIEERSFKNHIQMNPISETREKYVKGELFAIEEKVVIRETTEVGTIKLLGANYVIVEASDGKRYRKWLSDVEKLES